MNALVIAAPHSGSGKTLLTLGILEALKRRGLKLAPFKVGPDFIDPGYHRLVTGSTSVNLDGWMCPPSFVTATYRHHSSGADLAVIEGVMGLFDGIDGKSDAGSTAQVAKIIAAPVLLVVDARSQGRSVAALVHGFATLDPELTVAGVILNNVASENHERIVREALAAHCPAVALVGCVPRDAALTLPSRHLGLVTAEDNPLTPEFLDRLAQVTARHLDLELLLKIAGCRPDACVAGRDDFEESKPFASPASAGIEAGDSAGCAAAGEEEESPGPLRLAVARDAAFCFVYEDNLRLLREHGAQICEFSPLADSALPEDISGIYLPGGYPELFAEQLSQNRAIVEAIRAAVECGMPVYGECGGFMYLTRGVLGCPGADAAGSAPAARPFAGIFPVQARMLPRRKALGYREVQLLEDGLIGCAGTLARGHEFHYSETDEMPPAVPRLYAVSRKGFSLGREGYIYKNCLASYIHLHFGSSPELAPGLVEQCRAYRKRSRR